MEHKPPVPSQREAQSPGKRQKVEVARTDRMIANKERTIEELGKRVATKHRSEWVQGEWKHEDGTKQVVEVHRRVRLSEKERQQHTTNYLKIILQRDPSITDYAAGALYYGPSEADQQEHDRAITEALEGLVNEEPESFFDALGRRGPRLLLDPQVNAAVEGWWLNLASYNAAAAEQQKAKQYLKEIGTVLSTIVSGRHKIAEAEREAIVASCKKWRPICEELNKAFKKCWEDSSYTNAEVNRREIRGTLAAKYHISVADVQAIESRLQKPSRNAKKSSPTEAMYHRVAREHPGIGAKTVEKIWLDYLAANPDERRRKKRKTPTTSSADEKTA